MTIDKSALAEAESLRAEISEIDQQLMLLLGLRFRCSDQLIELEMSKGIEAPKEDDAEAIVQMKEMAVDTGVPPQLAVTLMHAVAAVVKENRERIKASTSH
jgi:chorismate mutase